ncbi:MAG: tetratricopeptide repeat protein [Anaerolineae bacterium]|nr:tetratricopeptide repeat protein [Anaerolineae bacterium]
MEAIPIYNGIIDIRPVAEAYLRRGLTHWSGDWPSAVEDFLEATRLDPAHDEAYNLLGEAYAKRGYEGDRTRSIDTLNQAEAIQISRDGNASIRTIGLRCGAYAVRGDSERLGGGDLDRVVDDYTHCIADCIYALEYGSSVDFRDQCYFGRGRAYGGLGEREKAIADFEWLLENSQNDEVKQAAEHELLALRRQ